MCLCGWVCMYQGACVDNLWKSKSSCLPCGPWKPNQVVKLGNIYLPTVHLANFSPLNFPLFIFNFIFQDKVSLCIGALAILELTD